VWDIYSRNEEVPLLAKFSEGKRVIVAGSTWPGDEALWTAFINTKADVYPDVNYIIVPHEVTPAHIATLCRGLSVPYVLYSQVEKTGNPSNARVLIVDTIGLLSRSYKYGYAAYIGGGFNAGIHNILEPAVNGIPIIFGPKYHKFLEARELKAAVGAFAIEDYVSLEHTLEKLLNNPAYQIQTGLICHKYVLEKRGATGVIMGYLRTVL
jgi:3-deoxy-D-manno-octulosonic-acid transferase